MQGFTGWKVAAFIAFIKTRGIANNATLGKTERLKSRKLIELMFRSGKSVTAFPLRLTYLFPDQPGAPLQAGFTVSSKTFKKATDRNRIKRLLRETYRKQKVAELQSYVLKTRAIAVFIMYTGKELPDYKLIEEKMNQLLGKLVEHLNAAQQIRP